MFSSHKSLRLTPSSVSSLFQMSTIQFNMENLSPTPQATCLVYKDVMMLTADPPTGIKFLPNEGNINEVPREGDLTDLQVTTEGPEGTPDARGQLGMELLLGKDFPASPPKMYFLTKIFHPDVGASGEIGANVLEWNWTAELGIWHMLLTSRC